MIAPSIYLTTTSSTRRRPSPMRLLEDSEHFDAGCLHFIVLGHSTRLSRAVESLKLEGGWFEGFWTSMHQQTVGPGITGTPKVMERDPVHFLHFGASLPSDENQWILESQVVLPGRLHVFVRGWPASISMGGHRTKTQWHCHASGEGGEKGAMWQATTMKSHGSAKSKDEDLNTYQA